MIFDFASDFHFATFRGNYAVTKFYSIVSGVGRGVNKLVSTLNPLKLSPNAMRKNLANSSDDLSQAQLATAARPAIQETTGNNWEGKRDVMVKEVDEMKMKEMKMKDENERNMKGEEIKGEEMRGKEMKGKDLIVREENKMKLKR